MIDQQSVIIGAILAGQTGHIARICLTTARDATTSPSWPKIGMTLALLPRSIEIAAAHIQVEQGRTDASIFTESRPLEPAVPSPRGKVPG